MSAEHSGIRPVNAYILVKTEEGMADRLVGHLREAISGAEVRRVNGVYDIVVALTADAPEYITAVLRDHLRPVPEVAEAEVLTWIDDDLTLPVPGLESRPLGS